MSEGPADRPGGDSGSVKADIVWAAAIKSGADVFEVPQMRAADWALYKGPVREYIHTDLVKRTNRPPRSVGTPRSEPYG